MADPNFEKMPADYKAKYRKMIEQDKKQKEEKKKNKSKLEQFADKLYGGNK